MGFKLYPVLLAGLVTIAACRSSHGLSANEKKNGNKKGESVCSIIPAPGNQPLNWQKEPDRVLKEVNAAMLPAVYTVYRIDSAELKAFFSAARLSRENSKAEVVVPLPQPIGCRLFAVFEAGTMPEELKKKFPDIVSLKGMDKETPASDIRLEYNGRMMQGQVTRDGETYFIKPVTSGNRFYYLIYAKSDVKRKKQDFENNNSNNNTNTQNNNKPVILKYDR